MCYWRDAKRPQPAAVLAAVAAAAASGQQSQHQGETWGTAREAATAVSLLRCPLSAAPRPERSSTNSSSTRVGQPQLYRDGAATATAPAPAAGGLSPLPVFVAGVGCVSASLPSARIPPPAACTAMAEIGGLDVIFSTVGAEIAAGPQGAPGKYKERLEGLLGVTCFSVISALNLARARL